MEVHMKKRCISAYVENQIGVLAKISGLFAGKNYNLDTLTVGQGKALAVILTSIAMKQITILKQVWLTLCLLRSYLCLSLGISCLPVKTKMKMETKTILLMWS